MDIIDPPVSAFSRCLRDLLNFTKFRALLICSAVLFGPLAAAAWAASISTKKTVSVRVVQSYRIRTYPEHAVGYGSPASLRSAWTLIRTGSTVACGSESDGADLMAITTESSEADKPIIKVRSFGATEARARIPEKIIDGTTRAIEKIIHWGLFPVDARLTFSTLGHDRSVEPALAESGDRTVKLIIDF